MITAILSILGSSAFGTILGGIFAILNKRTDIELKKLDYSHELSLRDKDLDIARAEAQGHKDVAIIEGESAVDVARMNGIAVANQADNVSADEIKAAGKLGWLYVIAAVFNKLIRPVSTVLFTTTALYLNWVIIEHMTQNWEQYTEAQQYDIAMQAFAWITGQASAILGYWFFSRGKSK